MKIEPASRIFKDLPHSLDNLIIKSRISSDNFVRILSVGDIGLSGNVRDKFGLAGNYENIFTEIKPLLDTADIVFGNLETPLVPISSIKDLFAADPKAVTDLSYVGFNVLHLANNHILDYGKSGLISTIDYLKTNDIIPLGTGNSQNEAKKLLITEINSVKIGWLGCGHTNIKQGLTPPFFWEYEENELLAHVKEVRDQVDVLFISIHIGMMYLDYPKPELKLASEKLLASGADVVLMHHAHVLQSIQVTHDEKICCYNLGNLVMDYHEGNIEILEMEKEQNESAVFVFDIGQEGICQAFAVPTYFTDDFVIRWATGDRGEQILNRLIRISEDIKSDYAGLYNQQRAERNAMPIIKVLAFHIKNGNWKFVLDQLSHLRFEHVRMLISYFYAKVFGA